MKQFYRLLLVLGFYALTNEIAYTQVKSLNTKINYSGYLPSNIKLNQRVHDNLVLLYNRPDKGKPVIVGFNADLKQQFQIELEENTGSSYLQMYRRSFYPSFTYNPKSDQILIVETEHHKSGYQFMVRLFDTTGKLVKKESLLLEMKHDTFQKVELAEDGSYFAVFQRSGKKHKDLIVTVFSAELQKLYTREIQPKENEEFKAWSITSQGHVLLVSSTANDQLKFVSLNSKGELNKTVTARKHLSGKENYADYLLKVSGERLVLAAEKNFQKALVAIDVFDVDFAAEKVNTYNSIEFNAENVAQLFSKVNEADILNKNYSLTSSKYNKPKYLEYMTIRHLLLEGDNILVVTEGMRVQETSKGKPLYFADDLLVTSFAAGKNNWNSIIGRRMYCGDASLGGWSSIASSAYLHAGKLQVVTCEYKMGSWDDVSTYHRTVDTGTGEVSAPTRLIGPSSWTNTSFTSWLTPNKIFLFRTGSHKYTGDFFLELAEVAPLVQ